MFPLFFKCKCSSPELRQVSSIPFFSRLLSSLSFSTNVERVRFVFRMRNVSPLFTPRKKCLRAGTTPARH